MLKRKRMALLLFVVLLMAACGAASEETVTDVTQVVTDEAVTEVASNAGPTPTPSRTETPLPTRTLEPTPEPTHTPTPTLHPTDTPTPTPEPSRTPTSTPEPLPEVKITNNTARVRSGPGTHYEAIGTLQESDVALVLATNEDGTWYNIQLPDNTTGWLAASLTRPLDDGALASLSEAATIPAPPTALPTSVAPPTSVAHPTSTAEPATADPQTPDAPLAGPTEPSQTPGTEGILVLTLVNQTPNRDVDVRLWDCCSTTTYVVEIGETLVKEVPAGDYGLGVQSGSCKRDLPNIDPANVAITLMFIPTDDRCDWYIQSFGLDPD